MAASSTARERAVSDVVAADDALLEIFFHDASDAAMAIVDARGLIRRWSIGAERVTGYAAVDVVGKNARCLYTTAEIDAGFPERALEIAATKGRSARTANRRRKDGTTYISEIVTIAAATNSGAPSSFALVIRDDTDRIRADEIERALVREREARVGAERARRRLAVLAELGEHALMGASATALFEEACGRVRQTIDARVSELVELVDSGDPAIRFVLVIRASTEVTTIGAAAGGLGDATPASQAIATGEPIGAVDAPPPRHLAGLALRASLAVVVRGTETPFGALVVHAEERRAFSADDVDFLQSIANVLAYAIERKRSDDALRGSEERFRSLAEAISPMVWTTQPDGSLDYANERWLEFTGLSFERGERGGWLEPVHEADRERVTAAWTQAMATGAGFSIEIRYRRGFDGAYRWQLCRAIPLHDREGRLVKWFATATDIEDQKRTEDALRESEAVAQRAVTAREDVLAIVSHDLRNPLGVVLGNAQLLAKNAPEGAAGDRIRKQANLIRRASDRMERLIEDLLDAARIESGSLTLEPSPASVGALVRDSLEMLEALAAEKNIVIEHAVAEPDLVLSVDRARFGQVLSNLIGNAMKFTSAGGTIQLRARRSGDHVRFAVIDSGPGVSGEDQEHLFDRYWQARRSRRAGAGLGLFIVRGIVVAHGGDIWVESAPGEGAKFFFTLPLGMEPSS